MPMPLQAFIGFIKASAWAQAASSGSNQTEVLSGETSRTFELVWEHSAACVMGIAAFWRERRASANSSIALILRGRQMTPLRGIARNRLPA